MTNRMKYTKLLFKAITYLTEHIAIYLPPKKTAIPIVYHDHLHEPPNTDEWLPLKIIVIPCRFLESTPQPYKIEKYCRRFIDFGYIDKPLTIHKKGFGDYSRYILTDGYIRYLICRLKGMEYVPVKYEKVK